MTKLEKTNTISQLLLTMVASQKAYSEEEFEEVDGISKIESMEKIVHNVIDILNSRG